MIEQDIVLPKNDNSMVQKILLEEKQRKELYPEEDKSKKIYDRPLTDLELKASTILGRITDKMYLADQFLELIPLYYDEALNWWMWDQNNSYWKIVDETDILIMVNKAAEVNVINSRERSEIINALKLKAREKKPKEVSKYTLQFDKELIDIQTGDRYPVSSRYFVVNPIPFRLGKENSTPKFDKLFKEWVKEGQVDNLYEILAYCLLPDYPIERIPCLLGGGSNGKSTYLKILYTFLGMRNICTTNLETLTKSRFETGRLFKKLGCIMAETNLANIENSQLIKRLVSGKDPVSIEFKNKGLTEFINYAKIIIATNNLPPTEDKTDGFYRRWLIIDFPNQFEKEVDVLSDITTEEYENLAMKCVDILLGLLKKRGFTNEGTIAERKTKYEEKSNPFDKFWSEYVDDSDPNSDITKHDFEKQVNQYMKENHVRNLSERTLSKIMREKGVHDDVVRKEWYENNEAISRSVRVWKGVKWKEM